MPDFLGIPPEENVGKLLAGPGTASLLATGRAWQHLSYELTRVHNDIKCMLDTVMEAWQGAAAKHMLRAVVPYLAWLRETVRRAHHTYHLAEAGANEFQSTVNRMVPLQEITANRTRIRELCQANQFGQRTPEIASLEARYQAYWERNGWAMQDYQELMESFIQRTFPFMEAPKVTQTGWGQPHRDLRRVGLQTEVY